jgi:hypothetical protein
MTDVGTLLLGSKRDEMVAARKRANRICPSIVGFVIGCGFGAVCEAHFGLRALALPAGLALLGLAMAQVNKPMVESADGFGPGQHSLPFKQP